MVEQVNEIDAVNEYLSKAQRCMSLGDNERACLHLMACVRIMSIKEQEQTRLLYEFMQYTSRLQHDMITLLEKHSRLQSMYLATTTIYDLGELWAMENIIGDIDCHWSTN